MAEPFKNLFNEQFIEKFSTDLTLVIPNFDSTKFVSDIINEEWENREFKQRISHITTILKKFLPANYKEAIATILELLDNISHTLPHAAEIDDNKYGLTLNYGPILDKYVELYGLDDYETSVKAIEQITQFTTCEFATHTFINRYPNEMMQQMLVWSKHPHWGVRRLASEGCRPRLPWAIAIPNLKKNPEPIIPILENLKNDPARFVRLSVANNLNDISKDNPTTVIQLAKQWYGESNEVNWILKHGCRTLLKQGNPDVMELFGFSSFSEEISIDSLQISTSQVLVGDALDFSFKLLNNNTIKTKIRLEYAIYYQKANGTLTKKVHKISERDYAPQSTTLIQRKHPFKIVTTRQLHLGLHQVAIIINGKEFERHDFQLI